MLHLPGMCAPESHNLFSVQKFHIMQAILLQLSLFMPPILLMKAMAATLSHITLTSKKFLFLQYV